MPEVTFSGSLLIGLVGGLSFFALVLIIIVVCCRKQFKRNRSPLPMEISQDVAHRSRISHSSPAVSPMPIIDGVFDEYSIRQSSNRHPSRSRVSWSMNLSPPPLSNMSSYSESSAVDEEDDYDPSRPRSVGPLSYMSKSQLANSYAGSDYRSRGSNSGFSSADGTSVYSDQGPSSIVRSRMTSDAFTSYQTSKPAKLSSSYMSEMGNLATDGTFPGSIASLRAPLPPQSNSTSASFHHRSPSPNRGSGHQHHHRAQPKRTPKKPGRSPARKRKIPDKGSISSPATSIGSGKNHGPNKYIKTNLSTLSSSPVMKEVSKVVRKPRQLSSLSKTDTSIKPSSYLQKSKSKLKQLDSRFGELDSQLVLNIDISQPSTELNKSGDGTTKIKLSPSKIM